MRGIRALLYEIIVDFFRRKVAVIDVIMMFFENPVVITELKGHRDSTDDLNLSAFVDEYVAGVHVTYFSLQMLKFIPSANNIVQQVPYFSFQEIFTQTLPVGDFSL